MSFEYYPTEQPALRPGIVRNRSNLTKEEWLERMQKKSIAQGKPLTWRQIKDDPELDHEQILLKLGPYALYENSLFRSVRQTVQNDEHLMGTAARNYKAAKAVKIHRGQVSFTGVRPLIEMQVPETDAALWNPRCIIAGNLENADSERWLSAYKLEFIDCLHDITRATLKRIFRGESKAYCISRAAVYSDRVEFVICRANHPSTHAQAIQRIVATVKPGVETRLFIGVTWRNAKQYERYAVCSCENTDRETLINVLQQQTFGIA